jgi:predicted P-loop ATPase
VRDDFAALRRYINETYKVNFSLDVIETIFNLCAIDNSYSPVVDYLEDMQGTWDGVERADTWLIDFLGTEDNAYYREAGRLVLDAAVTRAIYPGCKFDYVTIIEGPQGTGKSTLLEVLAKGHFTSDETTLEGKDALAKLSRYWFIEMCEMSGLKFADVNKLKAVITRSEDSYRPPYEKKIIDVKRSSIFMGTTNDSEYLKDSSGNRRYLPIRQGQGDIDIKGLKKVVDQIWAEVMHNHNKDMCYKLYLSRESEALVAEMRSSRTYEDPDLPEIINYISTPIPKNFYEGGDMSEELMVRENVTSKEISEQVLGIKWSQLPQKDRTRVNGLLKSIAFLNRSEAPKQFGRYGLFRYYAIDHMAMLMDFPKFYKKSQDLDNKEALLSVKECF